MKRGKIIASSLLAIIMCSSLITGATFALFTSESTTNIAVTSGNVEVVASLNNLKTYSAKADSKGTLLDENGKTYSYEQTNANTTSGSVSTFTNGGTASIQNGTLELDKITPGDKATFRIDIKNKSTVSAQYRIKFTCVSGEGQSDNGTILMSGLDFMVGDKVELSETVTAETLKTTYTDEDSGHTVNTWVADESDETVWYTDQYSHISSYVSTWQNLDVGSDIQSKYFDVSLPLTAGNYYENKACTIKYEVEVVQGNAAVNNDDAGIQYISVLSATDTVYEAVKQVKEVNNLIADSFKTSEDGQVTVSPVNVILNDDIKLEAPINVMANSVVNMDLAGKTLTINTAEAETDSGLTERLNNITVADGATFTLEGSKTGTGNIVIDSSKENYFTGSNAAITISNDTKDKTTDDTKDKTTVVSIDKINLTMDATASRKAAIYASSSITSKTSEKSNGIEITLGKDVTVNAEGNKNYCFVQAAQNTTVNIEGGVYNASGVASLFVVGQDNGSSGCELNFSAGTINITDAVTAIECSYMNNVYMTGGTINIIGSDTGAIALGASFGGHIYMTGGQINVTISGGYAYVAQTYGNYSSDYRSTITLSGEIITLHATGGYAILMGRYYSAGSYFIIEKELVLHMYDDEYNYLCDDSFSEDEINNYVKFIEENEIIVIDTNPNTTNTTD